MKTGEVPVMHRGREGGRGGGGGGGGGIWEALLHFYSIYYDASASVI